MYEQTGLWQRTLAPQERDDWEQARTTLREAYRSLRERARPAGETIRTLLPQLTVHDVSHTDALWQLADDVAGPGLVLSPLEAFVLGAAFVTHDLGLGLAAFPGGIESLRRTDSWLDTTTRLLRNELGRAPTANELEHPAEHIVRAATFLVLRAEHGQRAEQLLLSRIPDAHGVYLLEHSQLREQFGALIGRIAHSHAQPVSSLRMQFEQILGAPHWCPSSWDLDPLKVACLLRLADASHLDARRSPDVARALAGEIDHASEEHWTFQAKLNQPRREEDRLVFTASSPFGRDEAHAWWTCFDAVNVVDRELRQVDALLSDLHRPKLAARGVAGAEDPARLVAYIRVSGWSPVDSRVHITDITGLVSHLGGEELYGRDPWVPIRELIQNASDAVRARRLHEDLNPEWGQIVLRVDTDDTDALYVEVEDNGIGMSPEVVTDYLLNFGRSYWSSSQLAFEFPGLLRKGFVSTGRYGIGFFSVFMLGDRVRVSSKRLDEGYAETRVLEFAAGVGGRPVMRIALSDEQIRDGGTRVRVWLSDASIGALMPSPEPPPEEDEEGEPGEEDEAVGARRLRQSPEEAFACSAMGIAPALDVTLRIEVKGVLMGTLAANDWLRMTSRALCERLPGYDGAVLPQGLERGMRIIRDTGEPVARAMICRGHEVRGVAVVGGLLASTMRHVGGIFVCEPLRAARDATMPLADRDMLARWATQQAGILEKLDLPPEDALEYAMVVRSFGGRTKSLPIARAADATLNAEDVRDFVRGRDRVRLVQDAAVSALRRGGRIELAEDVLAVAMVQAIVMQHELSTGLVSWPEAVAPQARWDNVSPWTLEELVIETVVKEWGIRDLSSHQSWTIAPVGKRGSEVVSERVTTITRRARDEPDNETGTDGQDAI